jgi:alkaline phosphatase
MLQSIAALCTSIETGKQSMRIWYFSALLSVVEFVTSSTFAADYLRELQTRAIDQNRADFGHWGPDPDNYTAWGSHSNRLIPVYTFGTKGAGSGIDLTGYTGAASPYRNVKSLQRIYGRLPTNTVSPAADYLDQTNLFDVQKAAIEAGKKHVFLVIFDGMDWQTARAAAIFRTRSVGYQEGRGYGLHFQDYAASGTTQYAWMCTSPHNEGTKIDIDKQLVLNPGGTMFGGYDAALAGPNPWTPGSDPLYPIAKSKDVALRHAYTDSSSSASSMTAGLKTFNNAMNVDATGVKVETVAHWAQRQGFAVGAVSSVPISHATPAAAYAQNVDRDDFQDLTRDMLGLKSISHPDEPLPGLDVLIGGGFGETRQKDAGQGKNFVPGNAYVTAADLKAVDVQNGGRYIVATRTTDASGREGLRNAAAAARLGQHRLLGFYGLGTYKGHLPFQTADGDFQPPPGRTKKSETYSSSDLTENPTLADMTEAALAVLSRRERFWLMVEPGDVDWANHDNNIDNSIGAVLSGDAAVKVITDWVEQHSNWQDALLIVTADHGHYLQLTRPELLVPPAQ